MTVVNTLKCKKMHVKNHPCLDVVTWLSCCDLCVRWNRSIVVKPKQSCAEGPIITAESSVATENITKHFI